MGKDSYSCELYKRIIPISCRYLFLSPSVSILVLIIFTLKYFIVYLQAVN